MIKLLSQKIKSLEFSKMNSKFVNANFFESENVIDSEDVSFTQVFDLYNGEGFIKLAVKFKQSKLNNRSVFYIEVIQNTLLNTMELKELVQHISTSVKNDMENGLFLLLNDVCFADIDEIITSKDLFDFDQKKFENTIFSTQHINCYTLRINTKFVDKHNLEEFMRTISFFKDTYLELDEESFVHFYFKKPDSNNPLDHYKIVKSISNHLLDFNIPSNIYMS